MQIYLSDVYKYFTEGKNWNDANNYCKSQGGALAIVRSSDDNVKLANLAKIHGKDGKEDFVFFSKVKIGSPNTFHSCLVLSCLFCFALALLWVWLCVSSPVQFQEC